MSRSKPFVFSLPWIAVGGAVLAGLVALVVLVVIPWLNPEEPQSVTPEVGGARDRDKVPVPRVHFRDVTRPAGIRFIHNNGSTDQKLKLLPETMGSGVAFLDYNNDGHQDLLFVNSCDWPGSTPRQGCTRTLALYENDGQGHFTDVTQKVGLDVVMFGMGVTVGDFDNDGHPDLFITGVGGNRLFRNVLVSKDEGGKEVHRFQEVTDKAGLLIDPHQSWPASADGRFLKRKEPISFSTSATFLDYDGDGWLDLFVCNYVTWSPAKDLGQDFSRTGGSRNFGPPTNFGGSYCFLYRNRGRDKAGNWLGFEDVSRKAGIQVKSTLQRPAGKSLGVAVCDVDGDGFPDIIVANDTVRNFFFHNKGDGTFEEIGEQANIAYPAEGTARGGMGIDTGEYRPGRFAVLIGNFANEPNTFLRLDVPERIIFNDTANNEGIAGPSRELLKFGVLFFDYALDGRLDLLTSNGQLEPEIKLLDPNQEYQQPVQLFWNTGRKDSSFEPVTDQEAGTDLFRPLVGRGCAYGDIDGDGHLDVVLMENGGPARLLHNEGGTGNHCLRLVLKGDGRRSNTSAIGARVRLTAGARVLNREIAGARGYLSQSELPLTFGLGKTTKIDRVEIRWPGRKGGTRVLKDLKADHVYLIEQGKPEFIVRPLRKK